MTDVADRSFVLEASHSHLFPGARLTAPVPPDELPARSTPVLLLFSDDARAEGLLEPAGDGWELRVDSYRTEAGTTIDAKTWWLRADGAVLVVAVPER